MRDKGQVSVLIMATTSLAIQNGRQPQPIKNGDKPSPTGQNKTETKNKTKTTPNAIQSGRAGRCLSFIQINTNKAKRATDDLVLFSKRFTNPFIMVQEPYVNGKNFIPNPVSDLKVLARSDRNIRPRACVYYHKSLTNKLWFIDSLSTGDCTVVRTRIDNVTVLMVSCYMDRNDASCPPQAFKDAVNHANRHGMALVAGTDANAQNLAWNSKTFDSIGSARGEELLAYIAKENLIVENNGDTPTFDNGRWQNSIDLTITNKKGHDLLSNWQVMDDENIINSSDHQFITFSCKPCSEFGKTKFRDIAKTDWKKFQDELADSMAICKETFDRVETSNTPENIDEAAKKLADNIMEAYNSASPEIYVSNKVKAPPWETQQVREAQAGIRFRLRQARSTKADKDWSELRSHQAEYNRLVGRTKKQKFRDFCTKLESKTSSKRISAVIKDNKTTRLNSVRKPDGSLTETPEETLNVMTDTHFSVHRQPSAPPVDCTNGESMTVDPKWSPDNIFSERRVERALLEFDGLTAAGPDGIRPIMLQKGLTQIRREFAIIAKASFISGHVPKCWTNSTGIYLPKPGKTDYRNPKSFRTITLAPVPLKWMERIVLWHMETDLGIYKKMNKRQYGFMRGASTETALHKILHKIEKTIINSGLALGTFLDVEGAFDNVAFSAIERALHQKCESPVVIKWIMDLIRNRSTIVELNGHKRTIRIVKGCPQGGILSPFLWNLVVDSLLSFTKDKIPCDLQGFADDLALLATTEAPKVKGIQCFDADTLREMTQKSLEHINLWCKENGLALSSLKTHSVMFTWRRNWRAQLTKPIQVDGTEIEIRNTTKFLGVTLDSKLAWNDHIEKSCKKAKGILLQARRSIGPSWGFTPETMKWIYTALVRPCLTYAAMTWINGLTKQQNLTKLKSVQRLANILITGALPSSPGDPLNMITNMIPIDLCIEEEAALGLLRLKSNNQWINEPMVNQKGNLTTHTKLCKQLLSGVTFAEKEQDQQTSTLNIDTSFSTEIPVINDYVETEPNEGTITCYTDGSMMEGKVGAGVYIAPHEGSDTPTELSYHIGEHSTVFQAETFAVHQAAKLLGERGIKNKTIIINCDSQAAINAVDSTLIKSKTTQMARDELHKLGTDNNVILRWIPAHKGYLGNEKADELAKKGSGDIEAQSITLPVPRTVWKNALRLRSHRKARERIKNMPSHFRTVWRDSHSKTLSNLGKNKLRAATQYLTGHCELNYHMNKYKPHSISKICPHCTMEEETMNHFIGRCPMWSNSRGRFFNCYYSSVSDIADIFPLRKIIDYICSTKRLNQQ